MQKSRKKPTPPKPPPSLALMEIGNLVPALLVADRCAKRANVEIVGIESTMGAEQCIKLAGSVGDVQEAAEQGVALAVEMGTRASMVVMPGPLESTVKISTLPPAFIPLLGIYDLRVKQKRAKAKGKQAMASSKALGLIETQGLVASLFAADEMLKASAVELVGKEKIGAAYVTILVRGDVAAVQAAVEAGKQTVQRVQGTLILADVITHPHPDLAALLPE